MSDDKSVLESCREYKPEKQPGYYFCQACNPCVFDNIREDGRGEDLKKELKKLKELIKKSLNGNERILYIGHSENVIRRINIHLHGNSSNSTLRESLSAIFFERDQEKISKWMDSNIKIYYKVTETKDDAKTKEEEYIGKLRPPLNLQINCNSEITEIVAMLRKEYKRISETLSG